MQYFTSGIWRGLLLATLLGGAALHASAADVRIAVSARETYVGMPVVLQIQISNASQIEPPVIPPVDGLEIRSRGTPSRSTRITTINGKTTKTTSETYLYEIVPQREGSFSIPPISVQADGTRQPTKAIKFVASKSETGDLMFVEVAGKEQQIYVGQALDLSLKVWLRPFRDSSRNLTLSAADMWQMISGRSSWGAFAEELQQLANNGQRPAAQEVLRKDRAGVEHSYYLYEINATIYPKRPGKIDANDVHVIVDYPTALGKARDPFSSVFDDMSLPGGFGNLFGDDDFPSPFGPRLTVESVRPIVADATVEPIDVLPIPTANQPADYRGAVGHYQILTEATPSTVKAGDPINLLIGIAGTGPMELVQAPPLAELPELTADFKVPNEPLAGFVQEDRKIFSTTIRPRKEGVAQIPAIPFSFFDPQQDKFVTVHSKPISIHVDPADHLSLDAIVGRHAGAGARPGGDSNAASGGAVASFENYTGDDLLTNDAPAGRDRGWLAFLLILPPLVVLAVWAVRNRMSVSQFVGRFGHGIGRVRTQIGDAETGAEVGRILQAYLARRLAPNAESADAAAIVGALRTSGYRKLAVRCERLFHRLQKTEASGVVHTSTLQERKREALDVLSDLELERQRRPAKPARSTRMPANLSRTAAGAAGKTAKLASIGILAGSFLLVSAFASAAETPAESLIDGIAVVSNSTGVQPVVGKTGTTLTQDQRAAILAEASALYDRALGASGDDSADAKQAFADAAEKYQLLVNSGITNSRLYVNLANAYLESGREGKAIAYYRKALRLDPTNRAARTNLEYATQSVSSQPETEDAGETDSVASAANRWLTRYVRPGTMGDMAIVAWFALWLAIGLRLMKIRFPWKTVAATATVIAIVCAGSYVLGQLEPASAVAIVTSPSVTLREGDGERFPPVGGGELREGHAVELVKQRGDWLKIRSGSGQVGWLRRVAVESI